MKVFLYYTKYLYSINYSFNVSTYHLFTLYSLPLQAKEIKPFYQKIKEEYQNAKMKQEPSRQIKVELKVSLQIENWGTRCLNQES